MQDNDTAADLVAFLRDYARRKLNSRLFDARRCVPPYVVLDFGRQGLLGLRVPRALGGLGLGFTALLPVIEQIAAIDLTLTMLAGIHNELGIGPILGAGSPEAKAELLPALATGRMLGGFAMTEAGAGSNPRAIKGTATLLPNEHWQIDADKVWVGNGSWAGVLNVFARRAEPTEPRRLGGFVGLSVKTDKPGVTIGPEAMTMGMRAIVQTRLSFSKVEVEPRYLLGRSDDNLEVAESSFHLARFGIAVGACGASKRCAQLLLRYATRRQISTGPLADNPLLRAALFRIITSIHLQERLCRFVARLIDAGGPVPPELFFVCKAVGPEHLGYAVDRLVQFLGGRGYIEANEAPQLLRDARLLRIFEGPTETMRSHLGSMWKSSTALRSCLGQAPAGGLALAAIEAATEELWALPAPTGTPPGRHAFARYAAMGEVISAGVLWWLALTEQPEAALAEAAALDFATTRARVLGEVTAAPPLDLAALESALALSIGDVVQQLPGEEWEMDPLLTPA